MAIRGAEPGDVIEIRILDVAPRPCANPRFKGRTLGSSAAAWWWSTATGGVHAIVKKAIFPVKGA